MDVLNLVIAGLLGLDVFFWLGDLAYRKGATTGKIAVLEREIKWLETRMGLAETDVMAMRRDIEDIEHDLADDEDTLETHDGYFEEIKQVLETAGEVAKRLYEKHVALATRVDGLDAATVAHLEDEDAHFTVPAWETEEAVNG